MATSSGGSPFSPGNMLVRKGFISQNQLEMAKEAGGDPVERLLESGFVTARQVAEARMWSRSLQTGFPYADLERVPIGIRETLALPSDLAKELGVLPIKIDGNCLWAAFLDPSDRVALERAQEASGYRVIPVFAIQEDIQAALNRL